MPTAQIYRRQNQDGTENFVGINLDRMTPAQFAKVKGQLKGVQDHVLYDSIRLKAATAWAPAEVVLFQQALGSTVTLANDSTTSYIKTEADTNLEGNGGALPSGQSMVIASIQVECNIPGSLYSTPMGGASTIVPTRSTDASAENLLAALQRVISIRFRVDQRDYERGPISYFPADATIAGFSGSGGAAAVISGVVSNGFQGRYLARLRHLESLQRFAVFIKNVATVTITQDIDIRVALLGTLYTPVG